MVPKAMGIDINFYRWPPLVFGSEGGAFWKPMALAVLYGLSVATLMTLVVVPALYSLLEGIKEYQGRPLGVGRQEGAADSGREGEFTPQPLPAGGGGVANE